MNKEFDTIVIGSGPGGYVCAIKCAQLGMKTAIVEKYSTLGGTCLNVGCIPSKAWLDSSEKYFELLHRFKDHGISVENVELDFHKMRKRVEKIVQEICGGVNFLMKKNSIEVFHGLGRFRDAHTVDVQGEKESFSLKGKNIVIATGSKPSSLPNIALDKKHIITSTEALYLDSLPKSLVVIGGGVIGLELASVFNRLGTKTAVVEYADSLISTMDQDIGKALYKVLKKEGIDIHTGFAVTSAKINNDKVEVSAQGVKTKESLDIEAELCLMAVGRTPYTEGLNLKAAGVDINEKGQIVTNSQLKTAQSHIYAIGDVIKGAMLAHKAEEEGIFVAEIIDGQKPHLDYNLIPGVVYTWPEAASVGATEEQLKTRRISYRSGSFPFKALGRARASGESEGFVKVLVHKDTDEILGVHMVGPRCADMIAQAVTAMEFRASGEDVARSCHPHPTYTEAFKEACLIASTDKALHV